MSNEDNQSNFRKTRDGRVLYFAHPSKVVYVLRNAEQVVQIRMLHDSTRKLASLVLLGGLLIGVYLDRFGLNREYPIGWFAPVIVGLVVLTVYAKWRLARCVIELGISAVDKNDVGAISALRDFQSERAAEGPGTWMRSPTVRFVLFVSLLVIAASIYVRHYRR